MLPLVEIDYLALKVFFKCSNHKRKKSKFNQLYIPICRVLASNILDFRCSSQFLRRAIAFASRVSNGRSNLYMLFCTRNDQNKINF